MLNKVKLKLKLYLCSDQSLYFCIKISCILYRSALDSRDSETPFPQVCVGVNFFIRV